MPEEHVTFSPAINKIFCIVGWTPQALLERRRDRTKGGYLLCQKASFSNKKRRRFCVAITRGAVRQPSFAFVLSYRLSFSEELKKKTLRRRCVKNVSRKHQHVGVCALTVTTNSSAGHENTPTVVCFFFCNRHRTPKLTCSVTNKTAHNGSPRIPSPALLIAPRIA